MGVFLLILTCVCLDAIAASTASNVNAHSKPTKLLIEPAIFTHILPPPPPLAATWTDEFAFRVSNLVTDLRDEVRLVRLLELLSNNHARSLSQQLRVPAGSLLQKRFNVGLALDAM